MNQASCITVTRPWGSSAAPRVESVTPVVPVAATTQRRLKKKARATHQLVDTVREVVKAFELEYAQAQADSTHVSADLDAYKTQLLDLRRHLENESAANGDLQAVVEHRTSKNGKGDERLRALQREFALIVEDDKLIASRCSFLASDVELFALEHRNIREKISCAASKLDRAEATLSERERALDESVQKNQRLDVALHEARRKVEEGQSSLRSAEEKLSATNLSAQEAAAEAEALKIDLCTRTPREHVMRKEEESRQASLDVVAIRRQAEETENMIHEDRAAHAQELHYTQDRLLALKRQVDTAEGITAELEDRIRAVQREIAAHTQEHDAKRSEIAAMAASRKEKIDAEVRLLTTQLEDVTAKVATAEEAVAQASDRMKQANAEFSSLMAAMSAAFREYDNAVTETRELERRVAEAESALGALRERYKTELVVLSENRDKVASSNAQDAAAAQADRLRIEQLTETLQVTREAVEKEGLLMEEKREMIATHTRRVEEARSRERAEGEERAQELQAAEEATSNIEKAVAATRARLEERRSDFASVRREAEEWTPPCGDLTKEDLQRVEQEAREAVDSMRAGEDKAHAARLQGLKDTLATIREGGAERVKAQKNAAKARLTALQDKTVEVSRSLADLRLRADAAKRTEAKMMVEIDRREIEQRRAGEEEEAAAASFTAASTQAIANQAVIPRAPDAPSQASPSSPTKFNPRSNVNLSRTDIVSGHWNADGHAAGYSHDITQPRTSSSPSAARTLAGARHFVRGEGESHGHGNIASRSVSHGSNRNQKVTKELESTPGRGHSERRRAKQLQKKATRSSPKCTPTRSQQASESTAEATGSRAASSTRKKRDGSKNETRNKKRNDGSADRSSDNKHQKDKAAARMVSSSKISQEGSRSSCRDERRKDDIHRGRRTSDKAGRVRSKSKSKSPRSRPKSPRPVEKEYDLWTDNRLVGDSDFSFF